MTPIEQGRTMDIAGELVGVPTNPVTSTETIQKTALELFGVGMMDLDEASQKFVLDIVSGNTKEVRSDCSYVSYNQSVKYKWKSDEYKKKKRHYAIAVERVRNSWTDRPCDFEIVFAKSGRDYVYARAMSAVSAIRASTYGNSLIAARDGKRRIVLGYWRTKLNFAFAPTWWIKRHLKKHVYLWKK